jgi:hypothetical protein
VTSRNYDIKTLQDYLAGKLDPKAMHALESRALEDPVLADALEGLMANPSLTTGNIDKAMDRLATRLDKRIKADLENNASTASLTNEPVTNESDNSETIHTPEASLYQKADKTRMVTGRTWWRVAAILVVLLVGAWFYFGMQGKHGPSGNSADEQFVLNGVDTAISNQSLPGASSNEIASAINKVLADSIAAINNGQSAPDAITKASKIKEEKRADTQSKSGQHKIAMGKNTVKVPKGLHPITPNADVSVIAKRDTRMQREMLTAATMVAENDLPAEDIMDTAATTKGQAATVAPAGKALEDLLSPPANIKPMLAGKAGKTDINIHGAEAHKKGIFSDSTRSLGEVVVVGFGKQRKQRITGAAERSVNRKMKRMTNKGIMIKGRQSDSITPDYQTQPLFVVDGKLLKEGQSYSLDPKDIDKVTIINAKDGVPVYGKKAKNGVILFTTKKQALLDFLPDNRIAGGKLPKNKLDTIQNRNFTGSLAGKVPGIVVLESSTKLPLRQVHITRLSGDLAPVNGFDALKKYLEKKLVKGIIEQGLIHVDTARIYFQVYLENTSQGKRTKVTHITSTDKAVEDWFRFAAQKTAGWPDWQVEKAKTSKRVDDVNGVKDSAKMEITLFK